MRRTIGLALALLAFSAGTAGAVGIGIGVGAYGGMSIPVLQDDVSQGMMYGLRAPVTGIPLVTLEPYYASSTLGDKTQTIAGLSYTREGFDETAYGLNAMLATGGPVSFYPVLGIGQTTLKRAGTDLSLRSYNLGLGLGFSPVPKLSVHVRGELQAVVDGDTSRKFGNATVGASYALFSIP